MRRFIDLTDSRFSRWYVESFAYTKRGRYYWNCICDCGTKRSVDGCSLRSGRSRSCGCLSREITSKLMKGVPKSESHKQNLSGKNNGMFGRCGEKNPMSGVKLCGEKNHMFGKYHTEKTCKKLSKLNKGKNLGNKSPRWNPNLTDEDRRSHRNIPGYDEWRKLVYEKDNFTCQYCGNDKGGNLNAHHIESYKPNPKLRTKVSNGITFCEDCHKDFHHQYGRGNNTKEQLEEFLNAIRKSGRHQDECLARRRDNSPGKTAVKIWSV